MIDVIFWNKIADQWTEALDFEAIEEIVNQAETTASETIGQNNEKLLDLFAALGDYMGD